MHGAKRVFASKTVSALAAELEGLAVKYDGQMIADSTIDRAIHLTCAVPEDELLADFSPAPMSNGGVEIEWNVGSRYVHLFVPRDGEAQLMSSDAETDAPTFVRPVISNPSSVDLTEALRWARSVLVCC